MSVSPSVVLVGTSGVEVYQEIKKVFSEANIVLMTGHRERAQEVSKEIDLDGCLYKPFEIDNILMYIERIKAAKEHAQELKKGDTMANLDTENKILIVDDDLTVRDFLELFFKKKGYQDIQKAQTAKEGLELLEKNHIKLVLLDIRLPDMDGIEVLKKIKERKPGVGVIMITGFPEEAIAKEAMHKGAYDYIIKPFDLAYLELSVLTKIVLTP